MLSKAQKWASASIGAPLLGNMEGHFFLRAFLFRGIFMGFSRDKQNALLTGISLHRGPLGEPGGGSFAGTFERKEKVYLGSFLGPGEH
jgi:hypothetical protein